jgi:hypothetical protein
MPNKAKLIKLAYESIVDSGGNIAQISVEQLSDYDFGPKRSNTRSQYLVDCQVHIPQEWVERIEVIPTSNTYLSSEQIAQKVKQMVGTPHIKDMILRIIDEPTATKPVTTIIQKGFNFLKN